jgi:integrase
MGRPNHIPKHCEHKPTGRGFVRLDGKQVYTGRWGTQEAARRYERLVGEWMLNGRREAVPEAEAGSLLGLFDEWASHPPTKASYWRSLTKTVRGALVQTGAGNLPAARLTPKAFKAVRQVWIDKNLCRRMVNEHGLHLRAMLKWGVVEGLVPSSVLEGVRAVGGVRRGTPGVVDREPVGPVPPDVLAATLAELPRPFLDVARIQLLTAARPGEILAMRPRDIERAGDVWFYRPRAHKTAWKGKSRTVPIGPKAQAILGPLLEGRLPDEPVFHPPRRMRPYAHDSYSNAVARACRRAGVPRWGVNRLRHNAATEIRRDFGLDAVQAVLGHSSARISEIYAILDVVKAAEVVKQIG